MVEEVPDPKPGEGEVLVQVLACGVGRTVLNCIQGQLGSDPSDLPRVPGHELVGRILATGAGVDASREGELVTAYFYLFCGRCPHCLAGEEDICENLVGWVGVHRDGGYAAQTVLPERNAIRLPDGLDPVLATAVPDAIATPVHVASLACLRPGERVAVIAAGGGVGIHMVQMAALVGAEVAGLDVTQEKLAYLEEELGVHPVDSTDLTALRLPAGWNGKADVVIDFLGSPASLRAGLDALAANGRFVALTTFPGVEFPVSPRQLVFSQLSILGSRYATRAQVSLAGRLVATGRIRPIVGRQEPLEKVAEIHAELRAGTLLGRGALVWT